MVFPDREGLSDAEQEYNPTPIINEIRDYVDAWRRLPNPNDWQVMPGDRAIAAALAAASFRVGPPVLLPGRGG
jgi:type III restriction enzyme